MRRMWFRPMPDSSTRLRVRRLTAPLLVLAAGLSLTGAVHAQTPAAAPALKGLALGMNADEVRAAFPEAECSERLCVIELPEAYTLAQQPASRAMVGLYRGVAVAVAFELPESAWEDVCGALRAHPLYGKWRYRAVEADGKCVIEAPNGRHRVEVESARDVRSLVVTLIDTPGFEANQRALDRERARDL
jgi:hypothetical protein